jgi:hypothetical protein
LVSLSAFDILKDLGVSFFTLFPAILFNLNPFMRSSKADFSSSIVEAISFAV